MGFCIYCGKQINDGSNFCPYCGKGQPARSEPTGYNETPAGAGRDRTGAIVALIIIAAAATVFILWLFVFGGKDMLFPESTMVPGGAAVVSDESEENDDEGAAVSAAGGEQEEDESSVSTAEESTPALTGSYSDVENGLLVQTYSLNNVSESSYSTYSTGTYYGSKNVVDGDSQTAWNTNTNSGVGEYIDFRTDGEAVTISGIYVSNGYYKVSEKYSEGELFYMNNRAAEVEFSFSDGTSETMTFENVYPSNGFIEFDTPKTVTSVRLTVKSIYKGTKTEWNDLCIDEVKFYTLSN